MEQIILDNIQHELDKRLDFYNLDHPDYAPHRKFHELGKVAKERYFLAGNRVGKTRSASCEISQHLTGIYVDWWPGYVYSHPITGWVCGVSYEIIRDLERRYFDGGDEPPWISPDLVINRNRTFHLYQIRHISGGTSYLQFKTFEQKREKYQAAKIHLIHFDEEPPFEIYSEGVTRTAATTPGHHGMTMITATPMMGTTNMNLHYTTRKDSDQNISPEVIQDSRVYVLAGWENAPHIPITEQKRLISTYGPHEIEARTKGIPSLGSGMVYPVPESLITCDPFVIPDHWPRVFGLDFGWKDPTACLFAAHDTDNDVVYIYAEYSISELSPQHHAAELIKQGAGWMHGVYDPFGNHSNQKDGSKLADLYRQCGVKQLSKADNSREIGVMKVLQRMQNGKLFIVNSLHKTLREYRMYARKEGIIKDGNDHLMDCLRYLIMSGLPLAKTRDQLNAPWKVARFKPDGRNQGNWMR
jgi:phage terminase large subunit-like protein